jgi:Na+/H+ antiporter NhaD/arsenite permease-like protein
MPPRELWTLLIGVVLILSVGSGLALFSDHETGKLLIAIMIVSIAAYDIALFGWMAIKMLRRSTTDVA